MRERAAELGGSCTMVSRADGGFVVHARLPLEQSGTDADTTAGIAAAARTGR